MIKNDIICQADNIIEGIALADPLTTVIIYFIAICYFITSIVCI